jgi:hypothetical protein
MRSSLATLWASACEYTCAIQSATLVAATRAAMWPAPCGYARAPATTTASATIVP